MPRYQQSITVPGAPQLAVEITPEAALFRATLVHFSRADLGVTGSAIGTALGPTARAAVSNLANEIRNTLAAAIGAVVNVLP